ncbi:MAG: putative transport system permease protein [Actinomycetota bacterium]|jgi:hypothetical protein
MALGVGLGLAAAVVVTALAGAERTSSAYDRLVDQTDRADVDVQDDSEGEPLLAKIDELPGVVASDRIVVTFQVLARGEAEAIEDLVMAAGMEDGFGRRFDRPLLEAGRMPDPDAPSEILLNTIAAEVLDAQVGDRITVHPLTRAQFEASVFSGQPPDPKERGALTLTVAGIGRLAGDVDEPVSAAIVSSQVFATEDIGRFDNVVSARLEDGQAGVDAFVAAVEALPEYSPDTVSFTVAGDSDERVIDTIAVQRIGLVVFALVALAVVLVAGGQAVNRQLLASVDDDSVLHALGLSRTARIAALTLPFVPVAAVAAVVAGVAATAASPLLPVGFAGRIEPDPGRYVYPLITGLGVIAVMAFVLVWAALGAWRRTQQRGDDAALERPSRLTALAAAAGAGASVVTGLRLALESGRGRMRLPVRSTLAGVALGAGGIAAVLTFGASLDRVLAEPRLHGQPWTAAIPAGGEGEEGAVIDLVTERLPDLPRVLTATLTDQRSITIAGEEVVVTSLRHLRGHADPPYLEGRAPVAPDEVAIGPAALELVDAGVGDAVTARGPNGPVRLHVVGSPLVAIEDGFDNIAVMTEPGLAAMEASTGGNNIYITTDGPPEQALGPLADEVEIDEPSVPSVLTNLEEARGIPNALAVFLAVLAGGRPRSCAAARPAAPAPRPRRPARARAAGPPGHTPGSGPCHHHRPRRCGHRSPARRRRRAVGVATVRRGPQPGRRACRARCRRAAGGPGRRRRRQPHRPAPGVGGPAPIPERRAPRRVAVGPRRREKPPSTRRRAEGRAPRRGRAPSAGMDGRMRRAPGLDPATRS